MQKFEKTKGFLAGITFALLMAIFINPAFADNIDVLFNGVNIKINGGDFADIGQSYTLLDGTSMPFSISYKGTIYIPLRRMGELYGKDIIWDGITSTAMINDNGYIQPLSTPNSTSVPESNQTTPNNTSIRVGGVTVSGVDSVGGIDVSVYWKNLSGKDIKYITFTVVPYNAVGDKVSSVIGGTNTINLEVTGPIKTYSANDINFSYINGLSGFWEIIWETDGVYYYHSSAGSLGNGYGKRVALTENDLLNAMNRSIFTKVWYNGNITTVKLTAVKIDYMDGTKETFSGNNLNKILY